MTKIALLGQPNSGKTSLFNLLTGSSQEVGNWPGVTVERKEGKCRIENQIFQIIDLPGVYSLNTFTLEEQVTRDYLLNHPELSLINVVDANHLERQLFLTFQGLMSGAPMILALNMMDEVKNKGRTIDITLLSELLHIPVIGIVAREGKGLAKLTSTIADSTFMKPQENPLCLTLFQEILPLYEKIRQFIIANHSSVNHNFLSFMLLMNPDLPKQSKLSFSPEELEYFSQSIHDWEISHHKKTAETLYQLIFQWAKEIESKVVRQVIVPPGSRKLPQKLESLENWVLHPIGGLLIFCAVFFLLFQAIYFSGDFLKGYLEILFRIVSRWVEQIPYPVLQSLLSRGLLQGVGNILLLLPYIFFAFLYLSWLEDLGYLSRAAFIMDRFMHKLGLHGKSFIPLMLGFGCNVPAVMACRTLDTEEEKIKTIMMISFIPCSGRLPVLLALCGVLFQQSAGWWLFLLYLIGISISITTAFILEKTILHTPAGELIMELPPFRIPFFKNNVKTAFIKTRHFLEKAGTIIFLFSILVWLLSYFPNPSDFGGGTSVLGRIGQWITPLFYPLGFDYRLVISLISGFAAKELIISTLSILFSQPGAAMTGLMSYFSRGTLLAFLIFQLLYTPCLATVVSIKNETRSWKWPLLSIVYSLIIAWFLAWLLQLLF